MYRLVLYLLLVIPDILFSQSFRGKIVRVIEGDELLFETADSTFTIHLYGIDAPDKGQFFGMQTIEYLESYLWVDARIDLKKNINQDGISAILFIKGKNINKTLVRNGYAWYNRLHCINAELARAEQTACEKKLGLWGYTNAVPPWDFRKGKLAKPPPPDGQNKVLICTDKDAKYYHKDYCQELIRCHDNVIVILREQARDVGMKPCKYCY